MAGILIAVVVVVILIIVVTISSQRSKPGSTALGTTVTNDNHEILLVQTDIEKSNTSTKSPI